MLAGLPKLMRRVKGEDGMARVAEAESSSSIAFSSKSELELVDVLARRPRPVALVGDVPVMPRAVVVDSESLRRCCS